MKHMTIGLDIDGVIVDFVSSTLPLISEVCNRPVTYADVTHRDLTKFLNINEKKAAYIWEQIINTDLLQYSPPISGAIEGISALRQHEIWLVTGRPASMQSLTLSWLNENGINYDRIIFDSSKTEGNLSLERKCNIFVEDQLEVACLLAKAGIFTLLFNQPWNQAPALPAKCRRVSDWNAIVKVIKILEQDS
jgi:uncharacterized HAD superfamily protein